MSRFKKGQSGNPSGRPIGIQSPAGRLRQMIAGDVPKILNVLRERALDGDVQAAALLISRCLPPLRPESAAQAVEVAGESLGERAEGISAAALAGELSPSIAGELMAIVGRHARIIEVAQLEARISALENKHEK